MSCSMPVESFLSGSVAPVVQWQWQWSNFLLLLLFLSFFFFFWWTVQHGSRTRSILMKDPIHSPFLTDLTKSCWCYQYSVPTKAQLLKGQQQSCYLGLFNISSRWPFCSSSLVYLMCVFSVKGVFSLLPMARSHLLWVHRPLGTLGSVRV